MNADPLPTLDPLRTLDPALGLVSESTVYLPNDVGLWRTVGLLANTESRSLASAVGAFDVNRRASLTRGAGEAVERFALVPTRGDSAPLTESDGVPWYSAIDLITGETSRVPAPMVDYAPAATEQTTWDASFDPSPNGAASGPSQTFAQISGLSEVLERDAFLGAWDQQCPLHRVDVAVIRAEARHEPGARTLVSLLDAANRAGVEPILAFVPHSGRPLETAVCIIIGEAGHGRFGAVGIKASSDPIAALRGALQEGLQIRELFLARKQPPAPVSAVSDDESRAAFWATEPAVEHLRGWAESFRSASLPKGGTAPDVETLVSYLASRKIRPQWVDLTHRLPVQIQRLGWITGKAVCSGAIPLTMDESKLPGSPIRSVPHPLI
ncbi:YcaO-like family protein [Arthrobacter sp. fls2-241-R2A-200]|uniref:YcaO-like family protein n=1 Tax=Arthrobacter sp. fls2-241-R2A-200 TaxID=3040281 RepID=UPI00254C21DB|nr:YcaO-like family protein [Arthrobacter sp. fls2-241-R2A-200]